MARRYDFALGCAVIIVIIIAGEPLWTWFVTQAEALYLLFIGWFALISARNSRLEQIDENVMALLQRKASAYATHQRSVLADRSIQGELREARSPEEMADARERQTTSVGIARAEQRRAELVSRINERVDVLTRDLGITVNEHRLDGVNAGRANKIWQNVAAMLSLPFEMNPVYARHASNFARHMEQARPPPHPDRLVSIFDRDSASL